MTVINIDNCLECGFDNLPQVLENIVRELKLGQPITLFTTEGHNLDNTGLLDYLDAVVKGLDVDSNLVELNTGRVAVQYRYRHQSVPNWPMISATNLTYQHEPIMGNRQYGMFLSRPNSARLYAYWQHRHLDLPSITSFNFNPAHMPGAIAQSGKFFAHTKSLDIIRHLPYSDISPVIDDNYIDMGDNLLDELFWASIYKQLQVEIVLETDADSPGYFFTEKTIRPLYYGAIPLIHAYSGAIQYLRDQGFDMFDDLIDHSYDQLTGFARIDGIFREVERFMTRPLSDLSDRFKKNQEQLKSFTSS